MGGVTAAVLSVPTCVGFGILALAPLGAEFIQYGVLAGLYAAVCGGIISALMGGRDNTVIYSPRGIVTFLISALVAQNLTGTAYGQAGIRDPVMLMALVFLMVFLASALQTLYGILKFGVFAKYLPAPVLAGFLISHGRLGTWAGLAGGLAAVGAVLSIVGESEEAAGAMPLSQQTPAGA